MCKELQKAVNRIDLQSVSLEIVVWKELTIGESMTDAKSRLTRATNSVANTVWSNSLGCVREKLGVSNRCCCQPV
jgi:hypothetical protein